MKTNEFEIRLDVLYGKSKKSLKKVTCHASHFQWNEGMQCWDYVFSIYGYLDDPKKMQSVTLFGAMIDIISSFRSVLLELKESDPSIKYFLEVDGEVKRAYLVEIFGPFTPESVDF